MTPQIEEDLSTPYRLSGNTTQTFFMASPDLHFLRETSSGYNKIVSDEMFRYFETYVDFCILFCLSVFGMFTNSLNFLVFTRQGFKDGVNVSLMCVTCWDFLKCLAGFIHRLCGPLTLISASLAASWKNCTYPYVEFTSLFAGYVAYALTTYISVERCLCVTRPLNIKSILTPKFSLIVVLSVSLLVFMNFFFVYFIYEILFIYSPEFNVTIASYTYSSFYLKNRRVVMNYYKSSQIIIPTTSFIILCLSSAITVKTLKQSKMFLGSEGTSRSSGKESSGFSRRERQVTKMLLAVILVYIVNLFPRIIYYIGQLVEPEFFTLRKYHNFCQATAKCLKVLDFTNASIHFFIYLTMSSKFMTSFYSLFGVDCKVTKKLN